ncbi:MAG: Asp-tRNA(Asn)/Glu-tRNA(Gln) amidotransferase subunit GatB [Candidatus Susulua stagnicola]|nr:Asp-tRNA(Asn)/Glu-tRNA(Gln) amidotransferase subunit GatB [Candidatus Susulua stagnicola]
MSNFEIVIGLEVHTQVKTKSKIFCSCSTEFQSPPNTNICPVCCGYPGVLPVFNKKVLEVAVRVSLALKCRINNSIYFERKNYFYPDLPKGYQISQYKMPLGEEGVLELPSGKKVNINRVHMEEDAGKLIHKNNCSWVDFNRTGTPLLEIVSEPDIRSPEEAFDYLTYLKLVIQYVGASDCDMEKGSLRCDANISLRKKGDKLGTRVELKNMNSFRGVKAALEFEAKRQAKVIESGEKVIQETRLWDVDNLKTVLMRTKEQAHDYRYFPEPDLLDFSVPDELIKHEKSLIGELPIEKKERFIKEYKINQKEIDIILSDPWLANFFEEANRKYSKSQELSNWLLGAFLEQVNTLEEGFDSVKISPQKFAQIVKYFAEKKLNNLAVKKVLSLSITTNRDIDDIIEKENLVQVSGEDQLSLFIQETIKENPKPVKEYLEGKEQAIMFLVGQVMKKSRGNANPQVAKEMLKRRIEK